VGEDVVGGFVGCVEDEFGKAMIRNEKKKLKKKKKK
jgi:hypothetical protein